VEGQVQESGKIQIGSKANINVKCAQCRKEVLGKEAYAYKGKGGEEIFLCETCKTEAEKVFAAETKNPNIVMAVMLGSMAGVVAGIVWYFFAILTGYQIGYIALGVGFIIGWAVIFGSGKKRGPVLQVISAAITLATLFISEYFMTMYYYRQYLLENKAQFPDYNGEIFFLSPFDPEVLSSMISPMGLLIWGIGIYFAYSIPKSRAI
jgi:hypothetical protein